MGKNYFPTSNAYEADSRSITVDFAGRASAPLMDSDNHIFGEDSLFPELNEYRKVDSHHSNLGLSQNALSFPEEAIATIKMIQSAGSFKNILGYYSVSDDGTIRDAAIAFSNTRATETGAIHNFNVGGQNENISFFVIANGYNLNNFFSDDNANQGNLDFIYHYGQEGERLANITDDADDITLIYKTADAEVSIVKGPVYHATESSQESNINNDGDVHVISGLADGQGEALRIGFEDFPGLGDADFNDIVFDVSVSYLDTRNNINENTLNSLETASGGEELEDLYSPYDDKFFGSQKDFANGDMLNNGSSLRDVQTEEEVNPIYIGDVIADGNHVDESIATFINMGQGHEAVSMIASVSSPADNPIGIASSDSLETIFDSDLIV